jgi:diphthamide synthase (EF-2-diphthine--ammonia ligase)
MERAVENTGVQLVRPLWQQDQQELLNEMWKLQFDIRITCINLKKVPRQTLDQVKEVYHVGKSLTQEGLDAVAAQKVEISPTGEFGELHTMILDCPLYKKERIEIDSEIMEEDIFVFSKINSVRLVKK